VLRSPQVRAIAKSKSKTATMTTIDQQSLASIPIPLPPMAEQRRIAEVLDRAEALRAKRRAALAQLDSLTQSFFLDLFGDTRKERTRWPTVPLESIVRETKLGLVRGSQEFAPDLPIPYVRMNAITRNGELELGNVQRTHATETEIESYRLEPDDFLFNTRNSEELVGKSALYRGGGLHLFNNNLMRVRFTAKADPVFVAAAFKTAFVQHELNLRKSGTTNVFAIYYKDLRSLPLPLPPIELQREFARRATAVEKLKMAQRASLAEMDALFATLQHRAFRGELP
jgi:type I restriction enzyme S subunit